MRNTAAAVILSTLLLTGCSVPVAPQNGETPPLPERFSAAGSLETVPFWWKRFDDAALDRLEGDALAGNLSLQATWERFEQARQAARKSGAARYFDLGLDADATRYEPSGSGAKGYNGFGVALAASYEIDLWGRIDATADAAGYDMLASKEALRTASLSLSAEVASAWYALQHERLQRSLIRSQSDLASRQLLTIEAMFRGAQASATDVLQQRQSLEALNAEALASDNSARLYEHRLALLLGKTPGSLRFESLDTLPDVRALPATGLPSEVLMRRPDVRNAYFSLQAADRRLAAAVADRYPRITLAASAGSSALHASDLFSNWLLSLGASLSAPLFDGGERKAEALRSEAARNEAFYTYSQTLLEALKEVEDALATRDYQSRRLDNLDAQLALSARALDQRYARYRNGQGDFLSYLSARSTHEGLQRSVLSASLDLVDATITLERTLAGGWEPQRDENAPRSEHDQN